jgi:hypothetical protein
MTRARRFLQFPQNKSASEVKTFDSRESPLDRWGSHSGIRHDTPLSFAPCRIRRRTLTHVF